MPSAPKRFNPNGQPKERKAWERPRGTNKERGYGGDWNKLRNAYISENPICERCEDKGHITPAREVHHKEAFDGPDDPLRMEWGNLCSVCSSCHRKMEHERKKNHQVNGGQKHP